MSLFTDLKEVLTPYAQRIKGLAAADEEIKADLDALEPGLSDTAKAALLACFDHVAWDGDDPTGQSFITALENALYGTSARLSAVFTQGNEKYYPFDSLNSLKEHLVVRYKNDQDQTSVVTNYTLSGTLAVGTARIAVSYNGEVTHFNVNVESIEIENNRSLGTENEKDTRDLYVSVSTTTSTARCRFAQPIKNKNYTISAVDSTKYKIAGYDLANNILSEFETPTHGTHVGYKMSTESLPSWSDSWQVTGNYIICSFKKVDGTDFTASEIVNAYGTIYTVS